jgi:hypothetical protein
VQVVAKYFNVWDPPPNPAQRMIYLEKDILGKKTVILCFGTSHGVRI